MSVRIKFCGFTRSEDIAFAASLGVDYFGVVFAGGPRKQNTESASELFRGFETLSVAGIWGATFSEDSSESALKDLSSSVEDVPLEIVQLHANPTPQAVEAVREISSARIWSVVQVGISGLDRESQELIETLAPLSDAIVLDTRAPGGLGGSGRSFDWNTVATELPGMPSSVELVVAGGLGAVNVAAAVSALSPDIVDVSSGIEVADQPGIKDQVLMRQFVEAVNSL